MATAQLDKGFIMRMIQNKTNWSESQLRSFREDSLREIYEYIREGKVIGKAKLTLRENIYQVNFRVPKAIMEELGASYGDWFSIKLNPIKQEVVFDPNGKKQVKIGKNNIINLPKALMDKRLLREKDDVLVRLDRGRIVIKSFTYYQ